MPVLVTAGDGPLGRRLAGRLLAEGGEVRVYASRSGDTALLRGAGAFVAVGDLDDEGRLEAAMAEVHTVVHACRPELAPDGGDGIVTTARTIATAAANAGVRRLIALSVPGAGPDAGDELRRSAGLAEQELAAAGCPTVVLRTSLIDAPELRDALAVVSPRADARDLPVAPVRQEDVVELIAAFDAVRSRAHSGHVVFAADGPERLTLGRYLDRVGVSSGGLLGRVYRPATAFGLLAGSLRGPWTSADPALPDAWAFAGLRPHPIQAASA